MRLGFKAKKNSIMLNRYEGQSTTGIRRIVTLNDKWRWKKKKNRGEKSMNRKGPKKSATLHVKKFSSYTFGHNKPQIICLFKRSYVYRNK